jgi:hypothetical protein
LYTYIYSFTQRYISTSFLPSSPSLTLRPHILIHVCIYIYSYTQRYVSNATTALEHLLSEKKNSNCDPLHRKISVDKLCRRGGRARQQRK